MRSSTYSTVYTVQLGTWSFDRNKSSVLTSPCHASRHIHHTKSLVVQVVDRMDIVKQALTARRDAYTDADSLLRLARLLGVAQRSQEVRIVLPQAWSPPCPLPPAC